MLSESSLPFSEPLSEPLDSLSFSHPGVQRREREQNGYSGLLHLLVFVCLFGVVRKRETQKLLPLCSQGSYRKSCHSLFSPRFPQPVARKSKGQETTIWRVAQTSISSSSLQSVRLENGPSVQASLPAPILGTLYLPDFPPTSLPAPSHWYLPPSPAPWEQVCSKLLSFSVFFLKSLAHDGCLMDVY